MMIFVSVAKLVPVGYGIKKLQIGCVVEDDKVSTFTCGGLKPFFKSVEDWRQFGILWV